MACTNCDHRIHCVGGSGGRSVFWCPRCGTLKMMGSVPEFTPPNNSHLWPLQNIKATPKLLETARRVSKLLTPLGDGGQVLVQLSNEGFAILGELDAAISAVEIAESAP